MERVGSGAETNGYGGFFFSPDDENAVKLIVVMATQLCEQSENHWIVHFKWVKCM